MKRPALIVAAVLLSACAYGGYRLHRIEQFGRQVKNWANGHAIVEILREERARTGSFPLAINKLNPAFVRFPGSATTLLDSWGTPYLYFSDGQKFVLVSCGSGGVPDRSDYWAVRNESLNGDRPANHRICSNFSEDQILSDRGYHRFCGK